MDAVVIALIFIAVLAITGIIIKKAEDASAAAKDRRDLEKGAFDRTEPKSLAEQFRDQK